MPIAKFYVQAESFRQASIQEYGSRSMEVVADGGPGYSIVFPHDETKCSLEEILKGPIWVEVYLGDPG